MCKTAAEVVAGWFAGQPRKHLGFSRKPPKCARVEDTRPVARKRIAVSVGTFHIYAFGKFVVGIAANGNAGRKRVGRLAFHVDGPLAHVRLYRTSALRGAHRCARPANARNKSWPRSPSRPTPVL